MALLCTCRPGHGFVTPSTSLTRILLSLHMIALGSAGRLDAKRVTSISTDSSLSLLQREVETLPADLTDFQMVLAESKHRGIDFDFDKDPQDSVEQVKVWPLQFMHIPKNAGTAIESAAWHAEPRVNWGLYLAYFWHNVEMSDGNRCPGWHVPPKHKRVNLFHDPRVEDVFCFVRHPYDRAVSEYTWLLTQRGWSFSKSKKLRTGLTAKPTCTQEGLNHFLQTVLKNVTEDGQQFIHDCHFVPQSDYVFNGEKQVCTTVLKHREMPDNFNKFMQSKGYNISVDGHVNDSEQRCGLTRDDLDVRTKAMLDSVYAVDFKRLEF